MVVEDETGKALAIDRLKVDGHFIKANRDVRVTKIAIEPVWHLPGIAKRLEVEEGELRRVLFQETGGMYPEFITRPDLKAWLPPIGSTTVYIFGDPKDLANTDVELTCRVHDECNGSDVFGSDICTCRPYLMYGIEDAVRTAQRKGVGLIAYYRKEGRALGEVTKFLVYNARKRQEGGDSAATYFHRTECVAGVEDARFQEFMPDCLHFLGIKKIHNLHSMSNMKYDAIVGSGIEVVNRVSIPDHLIPQDAQVEMEAKKAAGYFNVG
ncbi:MAG: GTP cyclohydrolase II, partial [Bdellovibrionota bacterium]